MGRAAREKTYGGLQMRVRCGAICLIALLVTLSNQETCVSKQLAPGVPYTHLHTALVDQPLLLRAQRLVNPRR
jgi:hypothetical protein